MVNSSGGVAKHRPSPFLVNSRDRLESIDGNCLARDKVRLGTRQERNHLADVFGRTKAPKANPFRISQSLWQRAPWLNQGLSLWRRPLLQQRNRHPLLSLHPPYQSTTKRMSHLSILSCRRDRACSHSKKSRKNSFRKQINSLNIIAVKNKDNNLLNEISSHQRTFNPSILCSYIIENSIMSPDFYSLPGCEFENCCPPHNVLFF